MQILRHSKVQSARALVFFAVLLCFTAFGGGVVTSPDEISLRAALDGGGTVSFNCDGMIILTNELTITNNTTLDATGRSVILSGQGSTRIIKVAQGVVLNLNHLAFVDGLARGTNGAPGMDGGPGRGGAIYNYEGMITANDCAFSNNTAIGGAGAYTLTPMPRNGAGGIAQGGAIFSKGGQIFATNCTFKSNQADGGTAGISPSYYDYNNFNYGGESRGGAVYGDLARIHLQNCVIRGNSSHGGTGHKGASISSSGPASGGAVQNDGGIFSATSSTFSENFCNVEWGHQLALGGATAQSLGMLTVSDSVLRSNFVQGGKGPLVGTVWGEIGGDAAGGALYIVAGTAGITNSTLMSNFASGGLQAAGNLPGNGLGGGVYCSGNVTLVNCTISANQARSGDNGDSGGFSTGMQGKAFGGGICQVDGIASLLNTTLAGNSAVPSSTNGYSIPGIYVFGGGIFSSNGTVRLLNTIVADSPSGSNSFGTLIDLGNNLSSDASCAFYAAGSLNNTDPKLGPLDNYGGVTPTVALLAGSPAIDGGNATNYPATDQRGHDRPFGNAPDIGAFESSPPYIIRGTISGVTLQDEVAVSAGPIQTFTTNHGHYTLTGLATDVHSVTPEHQNYLFVPASQSIATGPDQIDVDFRAYRWNALSLDEVTNGVLHIIYAATNGQTIDLQSSADLSHWSSDFTNKIGPSNMWEIFLPIGDEPVRFYRTGAGQP